MNLIDRLRLIRDGLTARATVTFTRDDLSELLGESPAGDVQHTAQPADLTVEEVAERMKRKPNTITHWIRAGKLDAYKFNGREYRVTPAALDAYLQAQREGKQAPKTAGNAADLGSWRDLRRAA